MKRTGPTDINLRKLITLLSRQKSAFWKRIAKDLNRPRRIRRVVNISRINMYANDGETVIVPGKVLGAGELTKKLTIAAWSFSSQALDKIKQSGSKAVTIEQLLKKNKTGKGVRIIG